MNTDLLLRVPLFSGLPANELEHLAGTLRVLDMPPGAVLFQEQEAGNELFVVIDGHVEVAKGMNTPEERILQTIGPGEYLGEMSLLTSQGQRSAGARAKDHCQLWVMTRPDFEGLLQRQPGLAYNIGKVLSERLADFDAAAFQDLVEKNRQLQKAYDELKAAQAQITANQGVTPGTGQSNPNAVGQAVAAGDTGSNAANVNTGKLLAAATVTLLLYSACAPYRSLMARNVSAYASFSNFAR